MGTYPSFCNINSHTKFDDGCLANQTIKVLFYYSHAAVTLNLYKSYPNWQEYISQELTHNKSNVQTLHFSKQEMYLIHPVDNTSRSRMVSPQLV